MGDFLYGRQSVPVSSILRMVQRPVERGLKCETRPSSTALCAARPTPKTEDQKHRRIQLSSLQPVSVGVSQATESTILLADFRISMTSRAFRIAKAAWGVATTAPLLYMLQTKLLGLHVIDESSPVVLLPSTPPQGGAADTQFAAARGAQGSSTAPSGSRPGKKIVLFRKRFLSPTFNSYIPSTIASRPDPSSGQLVRLPQPSGSGPSMVRRIIGRQGEAVVTRNGFTEFVGPGQVWVEHDEGCGAGDNEHDSVTWGPIPVEMLDGVAVAVVWPPSEWSFVPAHRPLRGVDSASLFGSAFGLFEQAQQAMMRAQQEERNAQGDAYQYADQVPVPQMPKEVARS